MGLYDTHMKMVARLQSDALTTRAARLTFALLGSICTLTPACNRTDLPANEGVMGVCDADLPSTCSELADSAVVPIAAAQCPSVAQTCGFPPDDQHTVYALCVNGVYGEFDCKDPAKPSPKDSSARD
jgi:hypothetical protein